MFDVFLSKNPTKTMFHDQRRERERDGGGEESKLKRRVERKWKEERDREKRGEFPLSESLTSFWLVPMHIHPSPSLRGFKGRMDMRLKRGDVKTERRSGSECREEMNIQMSRLMALKWSHSTDSRVRRISNLQLFSVGPTVCLLLFFFKLSRSRVTTFPRVIEEDEITRLFTPVRLLLVIKDRKYRCCR